jgi:hypothetical protein
MASIIETKLVQDARQLYELWYGACSADDWQKMVTNRQDAINGSVATLAVPRMKLLNGFMPKNLALPVGNPIISEPICDERIINNRPGDFAGRLAQILVEKGHLVFFVTKSTAIDAQYSGHGQELKDIFAFAPVVVFYDNQDGRKNGFINDLLMTRQCGLLVVVRPKVGA